jgi:hypothetical protein
VWCFYIRGADVVETARGTRLAGMEAVPVLTMLQTVDSEEAVRG